jgi:nucleoside-diphosphate kinase
LQPESKTTGMAGRITFTMIKPDAVSNNYIGPILQMMNEAGFRICAMKYMKLSLDQAESFYAVHEGKPFFRGLVEFMSSGPIVAAML